MNLKFNYFKPIIVADEVVQANYNDYHLRSFFPSYQFNKRIGFNRRDYTLGIL